MMQRRSILKLPPSDRQVTDEYRQVQTGNRRLQTSNRRLQTGNRRLQTGNRRLQTSYRRLQTSNGRVNFLNTTDNIIHASRVLARIPKLAVQKFFWEWPNISVGVVALKVFWDIATETVAIKHMCWSDKAIIVFLNSGFKLLTSVLYARIIIMMHKHANLCMLKSAISRHI